MAPKILLVDDTRLFLELEKNFLKQSPVMVLTAADGQEALAVIGRERPDLVFLDLNMPVMDGAACCTVLKADAALRNIPVVMLTTAGKPEDMELCRRAGCDDFLTKPIDRRAFLEMGRRYIPTIDRREPRVPCRMQVICRYGGSSFAGVSEDLAVGGMYLASDTEVPLGGELEISFTLPGEGQSQIEAKGRVAWLNVARHVKLQLPAGFGVEFAGLGKGETELLRAFVDSLKHSR